MSCTMWIILVVPFMAYQQTEALELQPISWHQGGTYHVAYMALLSNLQLEALALDKYGSMDDVKAERQKRFQKRAERAEQRQEAGGELAI